MRWLFACALVLGCGHGPGDVDRLIGNACTADRDCEHRCYDNPGRYPNGFCSVSCSSDDDCPLDTFCVAEDGGVCLFACPPFECDQLGPDWVCRARGRVGGGSINVCFGK